MLFCRVDPQRSRFAPVRKSSRKFYRLGCASSEKTLAISGESLAEHRGTRGLGEEPKSRRRWPTATQGEDHKVEACLAARSRCAALACSAVSLASAQARRARQGGQPLRLGRPKAARRCGEAPLSAPPLVTAKQLYAVSGRLRGVGRERRPGTGQGARYRRSRAGFSASPARPSFDTDRAGKGLTYEQL
mgnify:CR=1 FL=1